MRRWDALSLSISCAALVGLAAVQPPTVGAQGDARYRIEIRAGRAGSLEERFSASQLALLEKLNRADVGHLEQLQELVVPESWSDELSYSVLPKRYASSEARPTSLVVYLPGQLFGAYEFGNLVRWGPVSSGSRNNPTSAGRFALNWRSPGRSSTVDPDWFMRWYFNFCNREGLAFHAYPLPGYPASHGCIRLLERDAQWLFEWGQTWMLDSRETRVLKPGTPVLIVGRYDFDAPLPWRSLTWLSSEVELPSAFVTDVDTPERSP
jgi:L,D-transpeptidase catalytic domain